MFSNIKETRLSGIIIYYSTPCYRFTRRRTIEDFILRDGTNEKNFVSEPHIRHRIDGPAVIVRKNGTISSLTYFVYGKRRNIVSFDKYGNQMKGKPY